MIELSAYSPIDKMGEVYYESSKILVNLHNIISISMHPGFDDLYIIRMVNKDEIVIDYTSYLKINDTITANRSNTSAEI